MKGLGAPLHRIAAVWDACIGLINYTTICACVIQRNMSHTHMYIYIYTHTDMYRYPCVCGGFRASRRTKHAVSIHVSIH